MSHIEMIDLTNSRDSSPSPYISSSIVPMILNIGHVSTKPNLHNHIDHHQHQNNVLVSPPQGFRVPPQSEFNNNTSQIATMPQLGIHSGSSVARVLQPLSEPNTFPFPNGSRFRVPWSQQEHDLFVMGLTEYGKGKWSKIAKHYVCNKTPQQVQCYARSFFKYLPASYVHRFKRKKLSSNTDNFVSRKNKETLNLFPMKDYREESSTFMNVPRVSSSNGEVDVELRLSLYK
ncbi:transcription factor MYBS3 [Lathyrus oleraceus]|nr:transcription factor MYBS3-like [Pisum sativum]